MKRIVLLRVPPFWTSPYSFYVGQNLNWFEDNRWNSIKKSFRNNLPVDYSEREKTAYTNVAMNDLYNSIVDITIYNKNDLSKKIYDMSEYVSSFSNDEYKVFLMLLRFILINIIKNNLGILSEFTTLNNESTITKLISFEILEFIDNNEKDLFIYNLDKKIFCLNIFIPLKKSYE